jgi:hypothetical protein
MGSGERRSPMAIDLNPDARKTEDPGLMEFGNGFSLLSARHLE